MGLKELVLGAVIGTVAGGAGLWLASETVGNYKGQQKMQQQYGVTVPNAVDRNAAADFMIDHYQGFLVTGAVGGAIIGATRRRRYY